MTTITTRTNKTTELSYAEGDDNISRDVQTKAGTYTADIDDNRSVFECTGTWDFTLALSSTMVAANADDYEITIKNVSTGVITVKPTGADTFDGGVTTFTLAEDAVATFKVTAATNGYIITGSSGINISVPTVNASTELQVGGTKFHTIGLLAGFISSTGAGGNAFGSFTGVSQQFSDGSNQMQMPIAGVIKNLHTYIGTSGNNLSGTLDIVVNKNGVSQSLTVQYGAAGDGKQSDVSNSFSIAKGDLISVETTAAAGTGTAALISYSVEVAVA